MVFPKGVGVQAKKPSMGGVWIYWGYTRRPATFYQHPLVVYSILIADQLNLEIKKLFSLIRCSVLTSGFSDCLGFNRDHSPSTDLQSENLQIFQFPAKQLALICVAFNVMWHNIQSPPSSSSPSFGYFEKQLL